MTLNVLQDDLQDTALHVAIDKFRNDSVAALVQLPAIDLRAKNINHLPPLHLACYNGNARLVRVTQMTFLGYRRNQNSH